MHCFLGCRVSFKTRNVLVTLFYLRISRPYIVGLIIRSTFGHGFGAFTTPAAIMDLDTDRDDVEIRELDKCE